jgi:hypothetical protein
MAGYRFIEQNEFCRRIDDDSDDNILELLLELQKKDPLPEIRFLNYYKEVPIFSPASITYAFEDTLSCRTADVQCRVIAVAGSTIIQSAALRHDVLAKALYQPETSEVMISVTWRFIPTGEPRYA